MHHLLWSRIPRRRRRFPAQYRTAADTETTHRPRISCLLRHHQCCSRVSERSYPQTLGFDHGILGLEPFSHPYWRADKTTARQSFPHSCLIEPCCPLDRGLQSPEPYLLRSTSERLLCCVIIRSGPPEPAPDDSQRTRIGPDLSFVSLASLRHCLHHQSRRNTR